LPRLARFHVRSNATSHATAVEILLQPQYSGLEDLRMPIDDKKKKLRLLLIAAVAVGSGAATLSGAIAALAVSEAPASAAVAAA
jgi:hypothetical protein